MKDDRRRKEEENKVGGRSLRKGEEKRVGRDEKGRKKGGRQDQDEKLDGGSVSAKDNYRDNNNLQTHSPALHKNQPA